MTNADLSHFGVLGMKWGRKKAQASSSSERHESNDHVVSANIRKKHLSEMSNEELKTLSTRLKLEKEYKSITATETSAGRKFVADVVSSSGKQLITAGIMAGGAIVGKKLLSYAAKKSAEIAVKKAFKGTVGWPG